MTEVAAMIQTVCLFSFGNFRLNQMGANTKNICLVLQFCDRAQFNHAMQEKE